MLDMKLSEGVRKMGVYKVRADTAKNRLYIVLEGFLADEEAKAAADTIISEAKKLKSGFGLINDISSFKPTSALAADEIKRAQIGVKGLGVGRAIRVVGQAGLAGSQFARTGKEAGYDADIVGTIEEAEKSLESAK